MSATDAIAMASGRQLLRARPVRELRVAYVNFEDPYDEIERRVRGIMGHQRYAEAVPGGRLSIISGRDHDPMPATFSRGSAKLNDGAINGLLEETRDTHTDVVIFDLISAAHEIPENANSEMNVLVRRAADAGRQGRMCDRSVHHSGKGRSHDDPSADDSSGATSLHNGMRSVRVLRRMSSGAIAIKAGAGNHMEYFRVFSAKASMAPPRADSDWYRLIGVDIQNATADRPSDPRRVVIPWEWPDPFKSVRPITWTRFSGAPPSVNTARTSAPPTGLARWWLRFSGATSISRPSGGNQVDYCPGWVKEGLLEEYIDLDKTRHERTFIRQEGGGTMST